MISAIFFKGMLPFLSLMAGGLITYESKRILYQKNSKRQLSVKLYEEFHSDEMYRCRLEAARVLAENPEGNMEDLYQNIPVASFIPLSKVFHWMEKVEVYEKNNQLDASLVKELLGRYFYDWYTLHYERLTKDLPEESEFGDMMSGVKYVASKMGKPTEVRYSARRTIL